MKCIDYHVCELLMYTQTRIKFTIYILIYFTEFEIFCRNVAILHFQ